MQGIKTKSIRTFLNLFFICFLLYIGTSSCKKDASIPTVSDFGYNYFPNTIGNYVIYDVDSIFHNDFTQKVDSFKYQIKEIIDTIFSDNVNRTTLRIERYKRNYKKNVAYSSIPWVLIDVWSANRTSSTAEKVEENQRFVKLIFPPVIKSKWNGNAANTMEERLYVYTDINVHRSFDNLSFDSTLLVTQIDHEDLIQKKYCVEIYAKNVGLIFRQNIDVESNIQSTGINPFTPLMGRITSGFEFKMTVSSFGKQ